MQEPMASLVEILTGIEFGSIEIVLIGLAILFLVTFETRIKRSRTLAQVQVSACASRRR
jgi:hypothetical protein